MTILYSEALTWLKQNPNATVAEIRNLVSQVSTEVSNSKVTILYSGNIGDVEAWKIAEGIGSNTEGVATIGQTDVAALLRDSDFEAVLLKEFLV
ncbi:MAG: hypothetical protein FJ368_06765 [Pelagibacterales bacterium]|nr:hypothetical protein [Pelagibacterales bacterium]